MDKDKTLAFTNTLNAVSPTDVDLPVLPFVQLLVIGFVLIALGGLLFRRKRREE